MADTDTKAPDYGNSRPATTKAPKEMGPGIKNAGQVPKTIQGLSDLEVWNSPTLYVWTVGSRAFCLAMSTQIEGCAAQCEARISKAKKGRLAKSVVSRSDAKKMMKEYHRASEACWQAANFLAKGWINYMAMTEELRNPGQAGWDYREEAPRNRPRGQS